MRFPLRGAAIIAGRLIDTPFITSPPPPPPPLALAPLLLSAIIAGRLIDTPREAARFVSLLACEKVAGVGAGKVEQWADPHTFLCAVSTVRPPSGTHALSPRICFGGAGDGSGLDGRHRSVGQWRRNRLDPPWQKKSARIDFIIIVRNGAARISYERGPPVRPSARSPARQLTGQVHPCSIVPFSLFFSAPLFCPPAPPLGFVVSQ